MNSNLYKGVSRLKLKVWAKLTVSWALSHPRDGVEKAENGWGAEAQ